MSKRYKNHIQVNGKNKVLITINQDQEDGAQQSTSKTVDSVHHIHVLDRSGSMYGEIKRLIENVKLTIDAMHEEDYISVVWFSGHTQCVSLLKGGRKHDSLNKLLDSIASTVGLTCFSTPMKEINEIIQQWKTVTPNFSVTIFTDGEPVVPWSIREEEDKIFSEINKFKDEVLALNTVGYGWYYNQDLLKRMAEQTAYGTAIHSTKIDEYLSIFNHNFEKIADLVSESAEISAPEDVQIVYLNTTSTRYSKDGKIKLTRLEKRKNQFFLLADNDFTFELNGEVINTKDIKEDVQQATLNNFYYSYSFELFNNGRRKEAAKVLSSSVRDKFLIDKLLNVFTYDEVANVSKEFRKAVIKPAARQMNTAPDGYIPRDDQFCVMDVLFALTEGANDYVVNKNYNRIGVQTVDEFNLFESASGEITSPFSTLNYNKEQLNISIQWIAKGLVKLNAKDAKDHNLPKTVDSRIIRNHTIIKDGNLNMEEITTIVDDETYLSLQDKEIEFNVNFMDLINDETEGRRRVLLKLRELPVINAAYGNEGNNIEDVFTNVEKMLDLEIKQKVLNTYIKQIKSANVDAASEGKFTDYTPEQIEVLKRHGLSSDFTYNGIDNQKKEVVDYYEARSISFVFDGLGTVPSVKDALDRMADPKKAAKANENVKAMVAYIEDIKNRLGKLNLSLDDNSVSTRDFLNGELKQVKTELKKERAKLHILKMAKVLTGDWFEGIEVNNDDEQTYAKNGKTMIVKQKRIKIDVSAAS